MVSLFKIRKFIPNRVKVLIKQVLHFAKQKPKTILNNFQIRNPYHQKIFPLHIGIIQNHAIGPLALTIEQHLRKCETHHLDPFNDMIFIASSKPSNHQLQKMAERKMNIIKDDKLLKIIVEGGDSYLRKNGCLFNSNLKNGVIFHPHGKVHLDFTEEENRYGNSLLKKMGLKEHERFILIHNRDDHFCQKQGRSQPWDSYRWSSFNDLKPGIDQIRRLGIPVIRTGSYENEKASPYISLNTFSKEEIDFLDIFLQRNCLFSICGDSGIAWIPYLFKKPVLIHNFIPMGESPPVENGLFIPKLLKKNGKLLSIREMLKIKHLLGCSEGSTFHKKWISAESFQSSYLYEQNNIEIEDTQPEDIEAAINEMLLQCDNKLQLSKEDLSLQRKFKESFPVGHPMRHQVGLISPSFLRKNQFLFD